MPYDFVGTVTLDKGRRAFHQLMADLENKKPDWNEAETRFQFIDPLLTKCLGWPRPMIHVEQAQDRMYTDYELGQPRAIIWEAKREGTYFDLPANPSNRILVSLASIMQSSPAASSAVHQVQSYCSARGVQYAVICNGHQLVAFLATRWDGVSPFEGNCLAFDGYLKIADEFPALWQNLSPEGVGESVIQTPRKRRGRRNTQKAIQLRDKLSLLPVQKRVSNNFKNTRRASHRRRTEYPGIGGTVLQRVLLRERSAFSICFSQQIHSKFPVRGVIPARRARSHCSTLEAFP